MSDGKWTAVENLFPKHKKMLKAEPYNQRA